MVALSAGTGSDTLVLKISERAWQGDAQYTVSVDGKQIGGTFTALSSHDAGLSDTLTLKGDWAVGTHQVSISFLNDAYGGSWDTDRNLYLDGATYDGTGLGTSFAIPNATPGRFSITDTGSAPVTKTSGTGSDSLVLKISQDAWQGNAQYTVSVDGKQIGTTFTAAAAHASGLSDTLTLKGDWAAGSHQVAVTFTNDAYGGTAASDRNLYVDGASYDGTKLNVSLAIPDSTPATFSVTDTTSPTSAGGQFSTAPVWSDEFNGTSIDTGKWTNLFGGPSWDNGGFNWNQNELSESNGQLHIGIDRQPDGSFNVGGMASYVTNWGGYGFEYGKVEIRAKASAEVTGAGACFLLWPQHDDHWPPEVDILETPKGDGLFTDHWQGPGGNGDNQQESLQFSLDYAQWHTYGLEWTPTRLTMLVDGVAMKTMTTHIPAEPMSIGLMGYVGAPSQTWYGGAPAAGVTHVGIDVDYARVYSLIA